MKKILIVDDENDMRYILKANFELSGFKCVTAKDGKEALRIAKTQKPALIILDLMMPDMDGFQTYKALKADKAIKQVPIIAYTAQNPDEVAKKGKEALDIVDFVLKPSDARTLIMAAKKALGQ
jgi:two-component system alkaline phosphatase synthesis response regulator PhoP